MAGAAPEQALASKQDGELNPLDSTGLCLLSLDGGGVRGLSSLYILKGLMARLNHERQAANLRPVRPCEVFDIIGGTSTGGLIAIMLGRLEMDIDDCIMAFSELTRTIFDTNSSWLPVRWNLQTGSQLESEIKRIIACHGASESDLLNDKVERSCRVFVCATAKETNSITRLRSYSVPGTRDCPATIYEAALATSALTTFFGPVSIGARKYVDGTLGANNPVDEVESETSNIWCPDTRDPKPLVKCFLSVGTGNPGKKAIEDNLSKFLSKTLMDIATETEKTATKFIERWAQHFDEKRYFRFNVHQGLQDVGLAECQQQGAIEAATDEYLDDQEQRSRLRDCVLNLKQKQKKTDMDFASIINEHRENRIIQLRTAQAKACLSVPFGRNQRFVGRTPELRELQAKLFTKDQCTRIAITGLGGVGKTQIVLELAYWMRDTYPDCSIFWIPATNIESLQQAYLELGRRLQIPGVENEQADIKKLVQLHLSQENASRWLLIFDNADDMDMWIKKTGKNPGSITESPRLIDCLPRHSKGSIVFTTRSKKIAVKLAQQNVITVAEMNEEVAMQLLCESLINKELLDNHQTTLNLLKQLVFLPLAIVQAAAYINANETTLSEYLILLEDIEQNVIELLAEDFEEEVTYENTKNPIATTWLISFEQIRCHDPLAAEYLSFMSCLDPRAIPQSLLPLPQSRKKMIDAIGTLSAYSFITKRSADQAFDLHRLVHLATRNWLRTEDALAMWTAKAVAKLDEVFPTNEPQNRPVWRAYLPHVRHVLESKLVDNDTEYRLQLLEKFGLCLVSDGRDDEAEDPFKQVIEAKKLVLGQEHPDTLNSMSNLALIYFYQWRLKEAETLETQIIEMKKRVLSEGHLDMWHSVGNLALTYFRQGRWKETEVLEVQVMEARKRVLGSEHPDTLSSINNLALTYAEQGRWKEAEGLQLQVIEAQKKVLGQEHPDTFVSLGNLASTYWYQERWKEAEGLDVQVMETSKKMLGQEHPHTLTRLGNLASTYREQKRWKEAEELQLQVMETKKKVLGQEHPNTLLSMGNLAVTWKAQNRNEEALELMKECSEQLELKIGLNHPYTTFVLKTLNEWETEKLASMNS